MSKNDYRYIIMCGGDYKKWETPRQLLEINGEAIVARTIRLLQEHGVQDIAISTNNDVFEKFNVPILKHNNPYKTADYIDGDLGSWVDGFYLTDEPVCYLFGDVVFTDIAINIITNTETEDIEFFASAPPFHEKFFKEWAEPFAFKVANTERFKYCVNKTRELDKSGAFYRRAIAWELWQVIKGTPLNRINYNNYMVINDETCDVDAPEDIEYFRRLYED